MRLVVSCGMDKSAWNRVRDIVPEAVSLTGPERAQFLERVCVDSAGNADPDLLREVEAMVAAWESADDRDAVKPPFAALEIDALQDDLSADSDDEPPPDHIGNWKVLRRLGAGGMGVVYAASRSDGAFDREVAIKLLRPGLYPDQRRRRFDLERRVLARLQHENIARLYDGGVTGDGEPFLVMEFVDGATVTDYCTDNNLSTGKRIGLFLSICDAVQYAHQNLVVHRDLKPSNVLVNANGVPKLLDFGIAKLIVEGDPAVSDDGGAPDAITVTGHAVMTPEYAAPEQVRGEAVNAATDVYSLGVLLYELLTGERPYTIESRTPSAIERVVCSVAPKRPSVVAPRLDEDLDTILLKALRKEPDRRYASALQLGDDLRRYLNGLPVLARPDTVGYRVRKFVGRHIVGVASVVALTLALVGGLAATMWQAGVARAEARKAEATKQFIQEMLASADPYEDDNRDVTVEAVLDDAASRVGAELGQTPEVAADVRLTIGTTYLGLGKYARADSQLTLALAELEAVHGVGSPETGEALRNLGNLYIQVSRFEMADSMFRRAVSLHRRYPGKGGRDLAPSLGGLGGVQLQTGRYESAEESLTEALTVMERLPHPLSRDETNSQNNYRYMLGILKHDIGEYGSADSLLNLSINSIKSQPEPWSPFLGGALQMHAWVKDYLGETEATEPMLREALAFRMARFGPEHIEVGYTLNDLAYLYHSTERYDQADSTYAQALTVFRSAVGDSDRMIATILNNRAALYRSIGRAREAIPLLEEAVRISTDLLGPDHVDVSYPVTGLGHAHRVLERYREAAQFYRQALQIRRGALPAGHTDIAAAQQSLGSVLVALGDLVEADALLSDAVAIQVAALGPDHRDTAEAEVELARLKKARSLNSEARQLLDHALPILIEAYGPEHAATTSARDLAESLE